MEPLRVSEDGKSISIPVIDNWQVPKICLHKASVMTTEIECHCLECGETWDVSPRPVWSNPKDNRPYWLMPGYVPNPYELMSDEELANLQLDALMFDIIDVRHHLKARTDYIENIP
jgi:hypothetical protein